MRDIYIIMKCENIKSLECKLVGKEYKFYYFDNSDPLENMVVVKPKFDCIDNSEQTYFFLDDYAFENVYIDEQGVLCYVNRFCKHCESRNVIRKDFNTRRVFNSKGKLIILKLKRYLCKDCGRKSQTELSYAFRPYARIPNQVIDDCSLSLHNGDKTVRQQSKDIELFKKIPISHETVRKALFTNNKTFSNK